MSLLNVIDRFRTPGTAANGEYTVTRTAAGSSAATGNYVAGSTSTFTIVASVQPHDGRSTVVLPEGVRTEDVRQLWTATELRVTDDQVDPDRITIPSAQGNETFHVFKVEGPWTMGGRTHYHVFAARRRKP